MNPFGNYPGGDPFPIPANIAARGFALPVIATSMNSDYETPQVQQYSLMVQRQLRPNLSIEAGYAGNAAHYLVLQRDINAPVFIPGQSTASNVNNRRPILPET